jgi:thymidylate kinase
MIVELIGVPGVGKTTILNRLKAINEQENFSIVFKENNLKSFSKFKSIIFVIIFFLNYPSSLKFFFTSFKWLIIKLAHRSNIYLADERKFFVLPNKTSGMLMPLISYSVQRNTDNVKYDVSRILNILRFPDILIVVSADIDLIVKRYAARGGYTFPDRQSRQDVVINSELFQKFNSGQNVIEKVINFAKKKKVKILQIDNSNDLHDDKLKLLMMEIVND